jgi:fructose-1,6-bisphosphatase/inositol monophosphatase family enzyme
MNTQEIPWELFQEISSSVLQATNQIYKKLGRKGLEIVRKNDFGDTALRMDVEAEDVVLNILSENNLPIRVISEEHGVVNITENPRFLGILDGLDGSNLYREKFQQGRYATMFAIFSNLDPLYSDYCVNGIMEHEDEKLYLGVKNRGVKFLVRGKEKTLACNDQLTHKINADTYFEEISQKDIITSKLKKFSNYEITCLRSSAIHYVNLISGEVDGVVEATRKNNLEIAIAYGLVAESGGIMIDEDGRNLADQKYNSFGQQRHIPIISARSKSIARELYYKFNS